MQALSSSAQSVESTARTFGVLSSAVRALKDIMQTNLGPCGTLKMLVSASEDVKLTKDGAVLLKEMQIVNPITSIVASAVSMQANMTGDGTTSLILIISTMIIEAEKYILEGIHPSVIVDGLLLGINCCLSVLEEMRLTIKIDRSVLVDVAHSALATKLYGDMPSALSEQLVDAIHSIYDRENNKLNLHMIEIMHIKHKTDQDTQLIKGIVMDHGARHPSMVRNVENAYIMTGNFSLEYEKT
ncbi:MAG: T-complex protein 1 subunit zeta [Paramarteilia canceri]